MSKTFNHDNSCENYVKASKNSSTIKNLSKTILYTVAITGALFAWRRLKGKPKKIKNPLLFSIGLGISAFCFYATSCYPELALESIWNCSNGILSAYIAFDD